MRPEAGRRSAASRVRSVPRRLRIALLPVPGQALGLAALTAVLGAALVSVPLVLGSAEEGAWQLERDRQPASRIGASLASGTLPNGEQATPGRIVRVPEFDDVVTRAVADAGLPAPNFSARLRTPLNDPSAAGRPLRVQLVHRDGAAEHLEIVAGRATATGALVAQGLADALGVGPGDVITPLTEAGVAVPVPVTGVYVEPTTPLPAFWEGQGGLFLAHVDVEIAPAVVPASTVLVERDLLVATAAAAEQDLYLQWSVPLERDLSIDGARVTAARVDQLQLALNEPGAPISQIVAMEHYPRPRPESGLREALASVDRTVELLGPPVRAVGIGGAAASLVLVGAWAGQRVRRRHDEMESLVARGLSPVRAGGQAFREALLPVAAGAAVGGLSGWLLIRAIGPSSDLPEGVVTNAVTALGIGVLAAPVAVAVVTAALIAGMAQVSPGPITRGLSRLPWLAVTAAVTVVAVVPLLSGDAGGRGLDLLTLVVPLLVTVVAAGTVTAALPYLDPRGTRLRGLPPALFLVLRRVLAGRGAARLVVVTTALSLGLVVYAGALADSSARTVEAKETVAAGSDVVVPLLRRTGEDGPLPAGSTVVGVEDDVTLTPGDVGADVLAVSPEEFAQVARWDDALADRPLAELTAALTDHRGGRLPVIVAGLSGSEDRDLVLTFGHYFSLPVEIVGRADAFPGQQSRQPLLVADLDDISRALEDSGRDPLRVLDRQVWATGETAAALEALDSAAYAYDDATVTTVGTFTARPEVRAQTWALAYLRAVSLTAGMLGLVGVAMHALAQQRRRVVAGLLLSRMGMSRRSSAAAAGLEVGLLTGVGALIAGAVALPTSAVVLRLLDPVPSLRPGPLFALPWGSIAAVVVGVGLVSTTGALLVGRSRHTEDDGEVMRGAA